MRLMASPRGTRMRLVLVLAVLSGSTGAGRAQREAVVLSVERQADENWALARQIWGWAEPGYQEANSAKALADRLEKKGFTVTRNFSELAKLLKARL